MTNAAGLRAVSLAESALGPTLNVPGSRSIQCCDSVTVSF
jgi:hypothetical protein